MLFILCESSLKLFNPQQKHTVEIDVEAYNDMISKMYDLHKRTQHLELVEWKRNHPEWFKNLFNISTAYETIDKMFKVKHESSIGDFDEIARFEYNKPMKGANLPVCFKTDFVIEYDCQNSYATSCKTETFTTYIEAYNFYQNQDPKNLRTSRNY